MLTNHMRIVRENESHWEKRGGGVRTAGGVYPELLAGTRLLARRFQ